MPDGHAHVAQVVRRRESIEPLAVGTEHGGDRDQPSQPWPAAHEARARAKRLAHLVPRLALSRRSAVEVALRHHEDQHDRHRHLHQPARHDREADADLGQNHGQRDAHHPGHVPRLRAAKQRR